MWHFIANVAHLSSPLQRLENVQQRIIVEQYVLCLRFFSVEKKHKTAGEEGKVEEGDHASADVKSFVQIRDGHFSIDGKVVYFSGCSASGSCLKQPIHLISKRFDKFFMMADSNLTVAGTWAFNNGGYRALQVSPGVYDEKVCQALDFVVNEAKLLGIRLVPTLVNNYKNFGGKAQYDEWANKSGGQEDDFYTNPTVKDYYRNHFKRVLTRVNSITAIAYRDDPTTNNEDK